MPLSQKRRCTRALLVMCLTTLCLLQACAGQDDAPQPLQTATPQSDAARCLVVALAQAPDSLDPADHRSRQSEIVIRNMFDGLVTRDAQNNVHLQLAESITWLDELTLQIVLRKGVLFHDGNELTADDVVFTFRRIILSDSIEYPEPHSSPRRSMVAPLVDIEKTGEYTVVMHLDSPWPAAMQMLVHQQIVPKRYMLKMGTRGFVKHPIGTGPYRFVSASRDLEEIVLEPFPDYYDSHANLLPADTATVDRVVFRTVPDALTRVAALRIGEVDIMQSVPPAYVSELISLSSIQVKTAPGTQPKWMELNVRRPPFDDVRVRRAMNYAIDKQQIIDNMYNGRAVALPGPMSPYNEYVNTELKPYPFDPERAQQELQSAGWVDSDGDGVLDRDGQQLAFVIDALDEWAPLANELSAQYAQIGIEASVRLWDYRLIRGPLLNGDRDAYLDDWGDSAYDPVGHFEAKWHSNVDAPDQSLGRANYSGYDNPRVNELIVAGERTLDADERHAIYDEAQQLIYDEAPAVFLVLPAEIEAASARLGGWEPASDSHISLKDIYWLD